MRLSQPNPADEVFDAPVSRMGVAVGRAEAPDASAAVAAPAWQGDENAKLSDTHEDNLLAWAVVCAVNQAAQAGATHLALAVDFAGFPKERAAKVIFGHVHGHLLREEFPRRVSFVFLSQADADLFTRVGQARREWMGSPRRK
jgi:hypothetical protein